MCAIPSRRHCDCDRCAGPQMPLMLPARRFSTVSDRQSLLLSDAGAYCMYCMSRRFYTSTCRSGTPPKAISCSAMANVDAVT